MGSCTNQFINWYAASWFAKVGNILWCYMYSKKMSYSEGMFPFWKENSAKWKIQSCLFTLIPLCTNLICLWNNITTWPDSALLMETNESNADCQCFIPPSLVLANFPFHSHSSNQSLSKLLQFLSKCVFIMECIWCAKSMPYVLKPYRNVANFNPLRVGCREWGNLRIYLYLLWFRFTFTLGT